MKNDEKMVTSGFVVYRFGIEYSNNHKVFN